MRAASLSLVLLVLGAAPVGTALGLPADPPSPPRPGAVQEADSERAAAATPDDEFIEFLGTDDVGDAAWWEFLKKSPPPPDERAQPPEAAP